MVIYIPYFLFFLWVVLYISDVKVNAFPQLQQEEEFVLPDSFLGTWMGTPEYNIIGPYHNPYVFSVSRTEAGDYMLEANLYYDQVTTNMGWQRFYVQGYGESAGTLHYCGSLSHFSNVVENSGELRLNGFLAQRPYPTRASSAVTFCLDSNNPDVMGATNPFKAECKGCGCANFTLFSNPDPSERDREPILSLRVAMSGSSKHLSVDMRRVGAAPEVADGDMALHGEDFSCEFHDGGRDTTPVQRHRGQSQEILSGSGCPFHMGSAGAGNIHSKPSTETQKAVGAGADVDLEHCYFMSKAADYTLSWTLDEPNQALWVSVSVPAMFGNSTWVALGFRPLSRSMKPGLLDIGTGHHMNFGMQGADIVAGSVDKGVRTLYAADFTGAPVPASYLELSNSSVSLSVGDEGEERVTLSFTRPLVGGYLLSEWGVEASLLSKTALEFEGDILWATGRDGGEKEGSGCTYHENSRGLRVVDWVHPQYTYPDQWKCSAHSGPFESKPEVKDSTWVSGEFKVETPTGEPIVNMLLSVLSDDHEHTLSIMTDSSGKANLTFPPNQAFVVKGTHPPFYQDLYIYGTSGGRDFQYTSFMGTRKEAQALAALNADIPDYDPSTGYLIVGMDELEDPEQGLEPSNLVPAVGASSAISGLTTPSEGFLFAPRVTFSSTITRASSSFVTYPNVQVGVQGQAVAYRPEDNTETGNSCVISPGFNRQVPPQVVQAFPDSVTVVSFIC